MLFNYTYTYTYILTSTYLVLFNHQNGEGSDIASASSLSFMSNPHLIQSDLTLKLHFFSCFSVLNSFNFDMLWLSIDALAVILQSPGALGSYK